YCREGRRPDEPDVLKSGRVLAGMLGELIGKELEGMNEEQMHELQRSMNGFADPDGLLEPAIFSNGFTKEEERFLASVLEHVEAAGMPGTSEGGEDDER
ncbi:MAG: hypothetical protein K0Q63_1784, partial [Paenibacillus sp.]|nr:hypothetical protein [Paenibacillus sp.]